MDKKIKNGQNYQQKDSTWEYVKSYNFRFAAIILWKHVQKFNSKDRSAEKKPDKK